MTSERKGPLVTLFLGHCLALISGTTLAYRDYEMVTLERVFNSVVSFFSRFHSHYHMIFHLNNRYKSHPSCGYVGVSGLVSKHHVSNKNTGAHYCNNKSSRVVVLEYRKRWGNAKLFHPKGGELHPRKLTAGVGWRAPK